MFTNLSIKARLVGVLSFLALLLVILGALGLYGMSKTNDGLRTVYEDRTVPMKDLSEVDRILSVNRLLVANALVSEAPDAMKTSADKMLENIAKADNAWQTYAATYLTAEEKKLADTFAADRAVLVKGALQPAIAAMQSGDATTLRKIYNGELRKLAIAARSRIEALQKLQLDVAKDEYAAATARYAASRTVTSTAIVVAILIAAAFAFFLVRAIVVPLNRAVALADAVAGGDLTTRIDVTSNNETGRLLGALKRMNENLAGLVGKVRVGVDTISTASEQIASGNADLSQRTEEQASSLEETASSMEELASTVKQNAQNASQANALTATASEIATKGGAVVGEVVQTMASINEASKKISDIIGVIDGIAFQTNILALNAAVEAARAGEQGRGFAVVASEVRTLAQRSAAAAKEIKELISDSVAKVQSGTRLVDDAGKTMDEIVASVRRVSDIMNDISGAALEQSSGIDQVNQAVLQMDHVTQQNAALVEEAAAAAESMREQAAALGREVSVFRLAAEPAGAMKPAGNEAAFVPSAGQIERRGADRAKNVTRLASKGTTGAPSRAGQKTGTDGEWNDF